MSAARDRVMREAGEKFDREQAAADTRAREQAASATATRFLGQHPQFRNLAALTGADIKNSPTGAAGVIHGQPAGRGTKAVSKTGGSVPGGGGKIARPAAKSAPGSRWAHFAGMTGLAPIADEPVVTDITSADAAAFITASAAKARGQKPAAAVKPPAALVKHDMTTAEGVAAFVAASAAKVRGPSR